MMAFWVPHKEFSGHFWTRMWKKNYFIWTPQWIQNHVIIDLDFAVFQGLWIEKKWGSSSFWNKVKGDFKWRRVAARWGGRWLSVVWMDTCLARDMHICCWGYVEIKEERVIWQRGGGQFGKNIWVSHKSNGSWAWVTWFYLDLLTQDQAKVKWRNHNVTLTM